MQNVSNDVMLYAAELKPKRPSGRSTAWPILGHLPDNISCDRRRSYTTAATSYMTELSMFR